MSFRKSGHTNGAVISAFVLMGIAGVFLMTSDQGFDDISESGVYNAARTNTVSNVISALENGTTSATTSSAVEEVATSTATTSEDAESATAGEVDAAASTPTPTQAATSTQVVAEPETVSEPVVEVVEDAESAAADEVDAAASTTTSTETTSTATTTEEVVIEKDFKLIEGKPGIYLEATGKDIYTNTRSTLVWNVDDDTFECFGNWNGEPLEHKGRQELYFNKEDNYNFTIVCEKDNVAAFETTSILVRKSVEPEYDPDGFDYYFIDDSTNKLITEGARAKPGFIEEEFFYHEENGVNYRWQIKNSSKARLGIQKVVLRVNFMIKDEVNFEYFKEMLKKGEELGKLEERNLEYIGYEDTPRGAKVAVFEHTETPSDIVPGSISEEFEFNLGNWASSTDTGIHYGEVPWFKVYTGSGDIYVND